MAWMVNARTLDKWFSRDMLVKQQTKVRGTYLDVLLKRLLDEHLVERQKVMGLRGRRVWAYRATELGYNWYSNPSLRSEHPRSTQNVETGNVPLGTLIERDGWVERWNDQVLHIPEWAARPLRAMMRKSRNYLHDSAKQTVYDVPAFSALCSYGKRTGYTLRLKFRLEPWRDHLADWLGHCGFGPEQTAVFIREIERQLPGSFKQEEHRLTGKFGTAVRNVEGRIRITFTDLDTGKLMLRTDIEHSRRDDMQNAGDSQIVDTVVGTLTAYESAEIIRVMNERGAQKRTDEAIILLAQGKKKKVLELMGATAEDEAGEDERTDLI